MCGRARCTLAPETVIRAAGTSRWADQDRYQPSYNLTPGSWTPVIHRDLSLPSHPLQIHTMRWGLVPSFTKPTDKPDPWRMFNARSESITEKPAFRRLVPTKRCLVLLDGFYEWAKEGAGPSSTSKGKQPYYIYLEGGEPMVMAGLFDVWTSPQGEKLHTYTILTTDSCKKLEWLHDRMPVLLRSKEAQDLWLATADDNSMNALDNILGPYNGDDLKWHKVTKEMSNPQVQGPKCSEELKTPSMSTFFQPRTTTAGSKRPPESAQGQGQDEKQRAVGAGSVPVVVNSDEKPSPGQRAAIQGAKAGKEGELLKDTTTATTDRGVEISKLGMVDTIRKEVETSRKNKAVEESPLVGGGDVQEFSGKKRQKQEKEEEGIGNNTPSSRKKVAKLPGQRDITAFFKSPQAPAP